VSVNFAGYKYIGVFPSCRDAPCNRARRNSGTLKPHAPGHRFSGVSGIHPEEGDRPSSYHCPISILPTRRSIPSGEFCLNAVWSAANGCKSRPILMDQVSIGCSTHTSEKRPDHKRRNEWHCAGPSISLQILPPCSEGKSTPPNNRHLKLPLHKANSPCIADGESLRNRCVSALCDSLLQRETHQRQQASAQEQQGGWFWDGCTCQGE